MLTADAMFTVIITTTVFVSYFCSSFYLLLSRAVSMKDMLFIDDFILIVVIQWSYCISSMLHGCLHGLYKVT